MADWPFSMAVRAVREGLSGRAGLRAYRAGGGRIQDARWFRAFGQARAAVSQRPQALAAPLNRRASGGEVIRWTTRSARARLDQVEVYVMDRDTMEVFPVPYSVRSQTGVTRQQAIDEALQVYTPESEAYNQLILGAAHVGAFDMGPGDI